jgi:2-polyprenyl-3-methyl-5-hydroxy-6-metoxy-1,4-benzoquinol methylase
VDMGIHQHLKKNYQKRKKWYGQTSYLEKSEVFCIETARAGLNKGDVLLEIGFGEGLFLDWAKHAGYRISGVEINDDLYTLAKQRGHEVFLGNTQTVLQGVKHEFDAVFLFDVLEHLTLEDISDLFGFLKTVLKENGTILVRVPNGGSPFGRLLQHGDATHETVLTAPKLQDIAQLSGLEVQKAFNGARTLRSGAHKNRILKSIAYIVRDIVQVIIGYIYYGENIPLDPNLTVVIGHAVPNGEERPSSGLSRP